MVDHVEVLCLHCSHVGYKNSTSAMSKAFHCIIRKGNWLPEYCILYTFESDQVTALQAAALHSQDLRNTERLKAVAEKNHELSTESHKTQLHNQLLIKCIGELTAVCKRKESLLEQLRRCIQAADKVTDIPLPPVEQVGILA